MAYQSEIIRIHNIQFHGTANEIQFHSNLGEIKAPRPGFVGVLEIQYRVHNIYDINGIMIGSHTIKEKTQFS